MIHSHRLLALILLPLIATIAHSQTASLPDPNPLEQDSTTIDELIDSEAGDATSWWEAMEGIPVLGELVSPQEPVRTYIRCRAVDPDANAFPNQDVRAEMTSGDLWVGTRLQRDRGEPDTADLQRIAFKYHTPSSTWIGGDFRIDLGLGWTVGSTPFFPSLSDPTAPLRNTNTNIRPQLSSEEGYGWRGAAVSILPQAGTSSRLIAWGGRATYDARGCDSSLVLYATQGNHTAERVESLSRVGETNLGASLRVPIGGVQTELIRTISRFDSPLAEEGQPARFRFGSESFGASGFSLRTGERRGRMLLAEASRQDGGAWGGGVVASFPSPTSRTVLSLWRATTSFAPLHSRPWIATGSDPAGRSGMQIGYQRGNASGVRWTFTGTDDFREETERDPEERSFSVASSFILRSGMDSNLEVRGSLRNRWSGGIREELLQRLLIHPYGEFEQHRVDFRAQAVRGQDGNGWGLSISDGRRLGRAVAFSAVAMYFATSGSGVGVVVIDPSLPGEMPVSYLTGRRLRLALRLQTGFPYGVEIALRTRVEHRFDPSEADPFSRSWAVSMIWKSPR